MNFRNLRCVQKDYRKSATINFDFKSMYLNVIKVANMKATLPTITVQTYK
jgi:hypothetical protein